MSDEETGVLKIYPLNCERCGAELSDETAVWLELSTDNGRYYPPEKFPKGHQNQGGFSFGPDCAKRANNG